jgi:hypothetical protein
MIIPNSNLVFIAYKSGFCGSLVYTLLALSPEVNQYKKITTLSFNDGTAHEAAENWIPLLHSYKESVTFCEKNWTNVLTDEIKDALLDKKIILVRCHPNTAYKLAFIDNVKIIYVTSMNKYKYERWAYEKTLKTQGDEFYENILEKNFKFKKSYKKITNRIKRHLLIRNFNHDMKSYEDCKKVLKIEPHKLDIDLLLEKNYITYLNLCSYLQITAIEQERFEQILNTYNSKQWKRF